MTFPFSSKGITAGIIKDNSYELLYKNEIAGNLLQCDSCGEYFKFTSLTIIEEHAICTDCKNKLVDATNDSDDELDTPCAECGEYHNSDNMTETATGDFYCEDCKKQVLTQCDECGDWHLSDDMTEVDNITYCESCLDENTYTCEHCDTRHHESDMVWFSEGRNEGMYCDDCIDFVAPQCNRCGTRYAWADCVETFDGDLICNDCYCDYYATCDDCGDIRDTDSMFFTDEAAYCEHCYTHNGHDDSIIRGYGEAPTLRFHDTDEDEDTSTIYMGVELEIDGGGKDHNNAKRIEDCFNEDHVYFNSDGSLNNGFEIISHPFTYDYYRNEGLIDMYTDAMKEAKAMHYRSHDTTTCGLHIHVGRAGLGVTQEEQDATLGKLWYLTDKFWPELVKFSRRTLDNLNRWAAPLDVENADIEKDTPETIGKKVTESGKNDRYHAINVQNSATIEFRLFRGTLNIDTFTATIELVHGLVTFARGATMDACKAITFRDFISTVSKRNEYKELENYTNNRIFQREAA